MRRSVSQLPMLRARATVLLTLLAFVAATIGVPIGSRAHARATGKAGGCCCAHKSGGCSCGCCTRNVAQKCGTETSSTGGSCCQKKKPTTTIPVVSCPCGGQPAAGFVVSTQPRFAAPGAQVPALRPISRLAFASFVRPLEVNLPPDTPPPKAV